MAEYRLRKTGTVQADNFLLLEKESVFVTA